MGSIISFVNRVLWRVASRYGYLLARHRWSATLSIGAIAAEYYLNFYKNRSYDRARNGEDRVVELLGLRPGDTVFDVGAHHGDYARYMKTLYPAADVHCFELSPGNIQAFRANAANTEAGLHLHEFGLGSAEGEFEIFESPNQSQIVSLHALASGASGETGRVRRGDALYRELNLPRIAFLKIDTEGHELEVLRGFGDMLRPECIACIQFEYNECSVGPGSSSSSCSISSNRQATRWGKFIRVRSSSVLTRSISKIIGRATIARSAKGPNWNGGSRGSAIGHER